MYVIHKIFKNLGSELPFIPALLPFGGIELLLCVMVCIVQLS
ncbi:hypothetical protein NTGBS_1170005 [Candidatus Nitrotoga sp. BS]|nr:hypothetical protein NTGBS_1170005 [Candidatus Nitrotoga sp. BS]